jgi:hypothetical protein
MQEKKNPPFRYTCLCLPTLGEPWVSIETFWKYPPSRTFICWNIWGIMLKHCGQKPHWSPSSHCISLSEENDGYMSRGSSSFDSGKNIVNRTAIELWSECRCTWCRTCSMKINVCICLLYFFLAGHFFASIDDANFLPCPLHELGLCESVCGWRQCWRIKKKDSCFCCQELPFFLCLFLPRFSIGAEQSTRNASWLSRACGDDDAEWPIFGTRHSILRVNPWVPCGWQKKKRKGADGYVFIVDPPIKVPW